MIVVLSWLSRFIIVYALMRIILSLWKNATMKRRPARPPKNDPIRRFNTKGKNISDADFKDIE